MRNSIKAKWFKRVGAAALLGFVVLLIALWLVPVYDIDPETVNLIEKGMTEREVITLLKAPPGWYAGPNRDYLQGPTLSPDVFTSKGATTSDGRVVKAWAGHTLMVSIYFDRAGRAENVVTWKVFEFPGRSSGEPFFVKLRRWLRVS